MGFWWNLRLRLHSVCSFKPTMPKRVVTTTCDSLIRPWADLPSELLPSIVDDLGLVDLLSFRGVCKSWRAAAIASLATARVESSPGRFPWLLAHGDGIGKSRCLLFDAENDKRCIITIPEMEGATCIASAQGWLLLAKKDLIFFFCPFSGSRIDLPPLPLKLSQLSDHVAAFSSPPTSDDCIVCVPNRNKASGLELLLLSRRDKAWNKHVLGYTNEQLGSLNKALFCRDGKFWFTDKGGKGPSFCPRTKQGLNCRVKARIPEGSPFKSCEKVIMDWFGGSGNYESCVSVSTCGTKVQLADESNLYIRSDTDSSSRLKQIWLHPRFYELPQRHSWTLSG